MSAAAAQERAPRLDARTSKRRMLACARCHEPVASSAWSGHVVVRCGACGLVRDLELNLDAAPPLEAVNGDGPYRSASLVEDKRPAKLTIALGEPLPGHPVESLDAAKLHAALARAPREDEDLATLEWERVWIAVWFAFMRAIRRDALGARVALETTLLVTRTLAYRALLLAHLAQHAAAIGAPGLAKKWLRACPKVGVVEVESEVQAARAMILLARDEPEEARRRTGDLRAGEGFSGNAVFLAIAINVEAHERNGDPRLADAMFLDLRRKKLLAAVMAPITAFGVGAKSLARFTRKSRRNSALRSALTSAILLLAVPALADVKLGATLVVATLASVASGAVEWLTLGMRSRSKWGRWGSVAASIGLQAAVMGIAVAGLLRWGAVAAPPPPVAEVIAEPSLPLDHGPAPSVAAGAASAVELRLDEDAMGDDELLAQARSDLYLEERAADAERLAAICVRRHPANEDCVKMLAAAREARSPH